MEPHPEKQASRIVFKNQPKLSGFEIDKRYDDLRSMLVPYIENFLSTDELFKDKQVNVEFSHQGVSSLLSFVEVGDEKYVLKIPLNTTFAEGEATFLKAWESTGVATPHILREGIIADFPYILMSYVDAPVLADAIAQGEAKEGSTIYLRVKLDQPATKTTKVTINSLPMQVQPVETSQD